MHWKVLDHPLYSLDLSPCNFHAFGPFKKMLTGCRFKSNQHIMASVMQWFQQQPREFSAERIQ
jgi:hypothetical protein